jgi:hypothetical protein
LLLGLRASIAAGSLLIPVATAGAQQPAMSGVIRHARGGAPMECLHVALLDSADRAVAHTVSDSAGMFVVVAPDTGAFRLQFSVPGFPELEGPLVRLSAGMMSEQEYPVTFDNLLSGELEMPARAARQTTVDLADWHHAAPSGTSPGFGRRVPEGTLPPPGTMTISRSRVAGQFIVDTTGRARASSWRSIVVSDPGMLPRVRAVMLSRKYEPARIGQQRVCNLVMVDVKSERVRRPPPLQ